MKDRLRKRGGHAIIAIKWLLFFFGVRLAASAATGEKTFCNGSSRPNRGRNGRDVSSTGAKQPLGIYRAQEPVYYIALPCKDPAGGRRFY